MLVGEEDREGDEEAFFDCPRAHTRFICFWPLTHTNTHVHTHAVQLQAKSAKNHTPMGQKEIATATVETERTELDRRIETDRQTESPDG